jgi:hypothetical protein
MARIDFETFCIKPSLPATCRLNDQVVELVQETVGFKPQVSNHGFPDKSFKIRRQPPFGSLHQDCRIRRPTELLVYPASLPG